MPVLGKGRMEIHRAKGSGASVFIPLSSTTHLGDGRGSDMQGMGDIAAPPRGALQCLLPSKREQTHSTPCLSPGTVICLASTLGVKESCSMLWVPLTTVGLGKGGILAHVGSLCSGTAEAVRGYRGPSPPLLLHSLPSPVLSAGCQDSISQSLSATN